MLFSALPAKQGLYDPEAEVELSWFDATELDLLLDVIGNS